MPGNNKTKSFKELEAIWYEKLRASEAGKPEEERFVDIEDASLPDRPLIDWHSRMFLREATQARRAKREYYQRQIDDFLKHEQLDQICQSITKHKNSTLTPATVKKIIELHSKGKSERVIAKKIGRGQKCVHQALAKVSQWMKVA